MNLFQLLFVYFTAPFISESFKINLPTTIIEQIEFYELENLESASDKVQMEDSLAITVT